MMKRKIKGNKLYGIKQYSKSSDCYEKAIKMFRKSELKDLSNDEKKEINAIQVACHSNTALCKLKEKKFAEAIESCNKALDLQENHAKSLYRRGQAHAYNSDDEAALVDLKAKKKSNQVIRQSKGISILYVNECVSIKIKRRNFMLICSKKRLSHQIQKIKRKMIKKRIKRRKIPK